MGMTPGEHIKSVRKSLLIRQNAMAKKIGLNGSTLCNYESGARAVPAGAIRKLMEAFPGKFDLQILMGMKE